MLPVTWDSVRLTLHVLAATVWVGGQITLAALVPALRRAASEATKVAARRFAAIGWPAFAVLLATGIWNIVAVRDQTHGAYRSTLIVKLAVVALSGIAAAAHQRAKHPLALALSATLSALASLTALFLGILLTT